MGIHIFDVDYTIINKTTAHYFVQEALAAGVLSLWQLRALALEWLRYKIGRANHDFVERAVQYLGGIDEKTIEALAQAAFSKRMRAQVYPEARRLIEKLHENGEPVYLATSSLYPLVQPLARYLNISESLASQLEFSDGKTTGRLIDTAPFGYNKKLVVAAWLDARQIAPAAVSFYSDSSTDLPLLQWCGHPVAVNPDRRLAREAARCSWPILHFAAQRHSLQR